MSEFFDGLNLHFLAMLIGLAIVLTGVGIFAIKADKHQQEHKNDSEQRQQCKH